MGENKIGVPRACTDGTMVNVLVYEVRGHEFNAHRYARSTENGQSH